MLIVVLRLAGQDQSHRMPPESFRPAKSMIDTLEFRVAIKNYF